MLLMIFDRLKPKNGEQMRFEKFHEINWASAAAARFPRERGQHGPP